jgi:hypothetical protein
MYAEDIIQQLRQGVAGWTGKSFNCEVNHESINQSIKQTGTLL